MRVAGARRTAIFGSAGYFWSGGDVPGYFYYELHILASPSDSVPDLKKFGTFTDQDKQRMVAHMKSRLMSSGVAGVEVTMSAPPNLALIEAYTKLNLGSSPPTHMAGSFSTSHSPAPTQERARKRLPRTLQTLTNRKKGSQPPSPMAGLVSFCTNGLPQPERTSELVAQLPAPLLSRRRSGSPPADMMETKSRVMSFREMQIEMMSKESFESQEEMVRKMKADLPSHLTDLAVGSMMTMDVLKNMADQAKKQKRRRALLESANKKSDTFCEDEKQPSHLYENIFNFFVAVMLLTFMFVAAKKIAA